MQATLTFPYNNIQPYTQGQSYQDYQFAIDCPVVPAQTPTLQVTAGTPPLILLPSVVSGGSNTLAVTQPAYYQNGQICFTVRATPDPNYVGSTDGVVLNLKVQVTYECSNPTDGLTPTAAATMFTGSLTNYPVTLAGTNTQNPLFYGHNPSLAGTSTYPSNVLFTASVALNPVPKRLQGAGGDVDLSVTGNGNVTCATVQVSVTVNQSQ